MSINNNQIEKEAKRLFTKVGNVVYKKLLKNREKFDEPIKKFKWENQGETVKMCWKVLAKEFILSKNKCIKK